MHSVHCTDSLHNAIYSHFQSYTRICREHCRWYMLTVLRVVQDSSSHKSPHTDVLGWLTKFNACSSSRIFRRTVQRVISFPLFILLESGYGLIQIVITLLQIE